jgi:class 3 adenylate cyclase/predicted ATPase
MTVHCPSCAAELPDGLRFCGQCGARLPTRCGTCGTAARLADQRFCEACGAALEQSGAPPRERRFVSVLFCDLQDFTTFSERRDAEDVRDVLEHYFAAARRVVAAYGGTIEKFIGDAVMAVWGAPVAREDDAERSVRAGLDIAAAVTELAQRLAIPQLRLRVGILTGEAAVDLGAVQTGMVIGDAVNTAARIQTLAEPGTVYVDDVTRLASERSIAYEPAGTHAVKGKSDAVRVWRAMRVVSLRGGARAGLVEPPLVGRDTELGQVKDAVDGLLAPDAGMQVVTVVGEAGLGKTRLVWEFEKYTDGIAARVPWLRGRALGFGQGTGFSALAEIVRMAAGIAVDDSSDRQSATLEGWLKGLLAEDPDECARVRRAAARLLGLDDGRELIEQGALFTLWRTLLTRLARGGPVVLIFEELHRADQALFDFLAHLLEWAPRAPILVLALGRPDPRLDELAAQSRQIELQPLTDDEIDQLVSGAVRDAPEALRRAVRADGGGVPLYAVETLRTLADAGVLAVDEGRYVMRGTLGELVIPPTTRALVASRLDRLGHLERRVLTAGAVLGENFAAASAATLSGVDEADARALLDGLVGKQLLSREATPRSPVLGRYCFLQGVVRRVLLTTLSRRVRKQQHLAAVAHLSRDVPGPDLESVLAGHLLAALEADPDGADATVIREDARTKLQQAAERAAGVGALDQALSAFDRAAELTLAEAEQAAIYERAGLVANRFGNASEQAAERFRRAGELHAAAGRERQRLGARAHELRAIRYVHSPSEMLPELRELEAALSGVQDSVSVFTTGTLAFTLYQCGQPEEALAVAQRAIAAGEALGLGVELLGPLGTQATSLAELERTEESIEVYRRARALAEVHNERILPSLSGNIAVSLSALGRYTEAAVHAREAIAAAGRMAERFAERWSRLVLARALCSLAEWDAAIAEIDAVRADVPPFQVGMATAPLVIIALARGEEEHARRLVAEHDQRCDDAGASVFESDFRAVRATVLAVSAGDADALAQIIPGAEVADYAEWSGWLSPVVDRLVEGGDAESLQDAHAALREPGRLLRTAPVLAQAERLAAHLRARSGDEREAAEHWARAERLAAGCGARFDAAAIALERAEEGDTGGEVGLAGAIETFERLRAEPWRARASRVQLSRA